MKKFKPYAWHNKYGDFVEFWAEDTASYAEWCNPFFEVHWDNETHEPVGFIVHWAALRKRLADGFVLDVVKRGKRRRP